MSRISSLLVASWLGGPLPSGPVEAPASAIERSFAEGAEEASEAERRALAELWGRTRLALAEHAVPGLVSARVKSPASLQAKALRKGLREDEILDRLGIRVQVPAIADCYTIRDLLHQQLAVVEGSVDDYIASPKGNGYQSLHSALLSEAGPVVELQVRTFAMHDQAEHGSAAHDLYKAAQAMDLQQRDLQGASSV